MIELEEVIYKYKFVYKAVVYYITKFEEKQEASPNLEIRYLVKNKALTIMPVDDLREQIIRSFEVTLRNKENEDK